MSKTKSLQKVTISRSKGVEICTDLLFKGQSRQSILQEILSNYKVSEGSIDKWIRVARPEAEKRLKEAEGIRLKQMDTSIAEAIKDGLLSDIELELILSKIASGGIMVEEYIRGKPVLREVAPMEQIQAVRTLYEKRGSNAPKKIAPTTPDGKDPLPMSITLNLS